MQSQSYDPDTGEILGSVPAPQMPGSIAKAIVAVMSKMKQIGFDEKNPHGGYGYVSVDKFYDLVGRVMATENLFILIDEVASEVREGGRGNPWLFARYELRFAHASGALSPPLRRSLAQPISGPQTFGAAQSYVEKQFLRQVFKIPTGEKDADTVGQDDAPPARAPRPAARFERNPPPPPPPPPEAPRTNGSSAPATADERAELRDEIKLMREAIDKADETGLNLMLEEIDKADEAGLNAILDSKDMLGLCTRLRKVLGGDVQVNQLISRIEKRKKSFEMQEYEV
jgi:hypothetical protein